MRTLSIRLERLEQMADAQRFVAAPQYRVVGGRDPAGADVQAFVATAGITLGERDIVVHRPLYRAGISSPAGSLPPAG